MKNQTSNEFSFGSVSKRKSSTAMNLSLFLPGLGQVYCGAIRRGLFQLCFFALLASVVIVVLATRSAPAPTILITMALLSVPASTYSAWDARRLALICREDYRLKDYNRASVYIALTLLTLPLAVGLAFSIREHFLHIFVINGSSMSPTFNAGQKIVVRKDSYLDHQPELNDLVAFLNPENRRETWVKRVVALPGDVLEIKGGIVHLNGAAIQEADSVQMDNIDLPAITIPEHHCYVLGDNRAHSKDSRDFGPVPMIALVGRAMTWKF